MNPLSIWGAHLDGSCQELNTVPLRPFERVDDQENELRRSRQESKKPNSYGLA